MMRGRKEAKRPAPGGWPRSVRLALALGLGGLVVGPQAAGADAYLPDPTLDLDRRRLDIREPAAVGASLGVADVMPELRALATDLTLGHSVYPFPNRAAMGRARTVWLERVGYDTIDHSICKTGGEETTNE